MSNKSPTRPAQSSGSGVVPPGEIEQELGVPMPGVILPPDQWVRTALKKLPAEGYLDWEALFGRRAPRVLDLGCGNGRFVVSSAVRRPEVDHLGLDALPVVIRYATRRANQRGLSNVRFAVGGAWDMLARLTEPGTLDEIHLYHPQPFPDQPESDRRLITPAFLAQVHRALVAGGKVYFQTDNAAYGRYIQTTAPEFFTFFEQVGPWPDDPLGRTRREIVATAKGLPIWRGIGERRGDLSNEQVAELVSRLPLPKFSGAGNTKLRRRKPPRRKPNTGKPNTSKHVSARGRRKRPGNASTR